jgi:hypothetical protein
MRLPHLCSELIIVYIPAANGAVRTVVGILEEISAATACLQLEENPGIATPLRFACLNVPHAPQLECTVTSCQYEPGLGYYAGVRFAPGFRWSPSLFRPAHLLDLERLAVSARPHSLHHAPAHSRAYGGTRRGAGGNAPATASQAAP